MDIFNIIDWQNLVSSSPELLDFFVYKLTQYNLLFIAIGFLVLLLEIRLPLRYYWGLPFFTLQKFLEALKLRPPTPVWGYCLDAQTDQIIPLTAIELIEEKSKKVIATTYSNRLGQYGFLVYPGSYIVRGIKNYYQIPSLIDPENVELMQTDESAALPVGVTFSPDFPKVNVSLLPLEKVNPKDPVIKFSHYLRTFLFALANGLLALSILASLISFAVLGRPADGLLIAVGIVLLFIKIYILETVGEVGEKS